MEIYLKGFFINIIPNYFCFYKSILIVHSKNCLDNKEQSKSVPNIIDNINSIAKVLAYLTFFIFNNYNYI